MEKTHYIENISIALRMAPQEQELFTFIVQHIKYSLNQTMKSNLVGESKIP